MVLVPKARLWATAAVSRCGGDKNPIVFALPRYREGIRPQRSWGAVVGAETARVRGLRWPAIVSRGEANDGRLAPPCVQRMERLRAEAVAVMPHCQNVRGVVYPHIQPARHSLEREQEASLDLCVEEGYCQGLQRTFRWSA